MGAGQSREAGGCVGMSPLQKTKMETPWHIAFICTSIRERVNIESDLSDDQETQLKNLLKKHVNIFFKSDIDIEDCQLIKQRIELENKIPFKLFQA